MASLDDGIEGCTPQPDGAALFFRRMDRVTTRDATDGRAFAGYNLRMAEAPPMLLPYADLPARYGIVVEASVGQLRITIPPRFLRFLPPAVVEVDATHLRLLRIPNTWEESGDSVRPREAIYEVKFVSHTGSMFVKTHGFQFLECRPHRDPKIVAWVVDRVMAALAFERSLTDRSTVAPEA